ncbi:UNVERIFIED_CONTAM: hypothetical protein Slati_2745900 [Sesamum latifolium]|uniref:Retrotransposon gag domain-containing protein n=1 Tax=Sesamum latifolium TaxID=2727402 RepID=A0AAW2W070_9LAMI
MDTQGKPSKMEHVEENQGFFPNDSSHTEYVQKDFGSPNHASEDDGNKSPPSSPRSVSSHSFTTNVAPVMVTNATTIEEQLASLTRTIEGLMKHVQEQDAQIARLIHKADNEDASHIMGKQVESHDEAEHVAHFVETCNNAGTYGDHLVKQFVRSLKGNVFYWYTDLEAGSIDGWEQLEQEFFNRFYSNRRTVSMVELTNSRQWKEESVIDYINRWRNLSLNWKDQLSEASAIEMCIQALQRIASPQRNNVPYEKPQRKLTLKEMQARQYPFLVSDVPRIFDDLLEANLIDLPEMKRPKEAERKDDPKYCKYHRLVGHTIQDCFVFKNNVMQLVLG